MTMAACSRHSIGRIDCGRESSGRRKEVTMAKLKLSFATTVVLLAGCMQTDAQGDENVAETHEALLNYNQTSDFRLGIRAVKYFGLTPLMSDEKLTGWAPLNN